MSENVSTLSSEAGAMTSRQRKRHLADENELALKGQVRSLETVARYVYHADRAGKLMNDCTVAQRVKCRRLGMLPGSRLVQDIGGKAFTSPIARDAQGPIHLSMLSDGRVYLSRLGLQGTIFQEALTAIEFLQGIDRNERRALVEKIIGIMQRST